MKLAAEIYTVSRAFPADERFGLTSQLRRAAVAVPSNLAEGSARSSRADYRRFVSIARGSMAEVDTELSLAEMLGFVSASDLTAIRERADHVGRMLTNLFKSLDVTDPRTPTREPRES